MLRSAWLRSPDSPVSPSAAVVSGLQWEETEALRRQEVCLGLHSWGGAGAGAGPGGSPGKAPLSPRWAPSSFSAPLGPRQGAEVCSLATLSRGLRVSFCQVGAGWHGVPGRQGRAQDTRMQ